MRRVLKTLSVICLLVAALPVSASAATGRVVKVLPHFLDLKGRHALTPSLYDRDAYQDYLRNHPQEVSGLRYDIKWKAKGAKDARLKLQIELRGDARGKTPVQTKLEKEISRGSGRWTSLALTGDDYKTFGKVTAWRATLWDGDQLLGEQKSFLW